MRAAKVFNYLISVPEARAGVSALALREAIETEFVLAALKLAPVPPPAWADEHWPWAMSLRCFGGFRNVVKFAEGQSASKASSRPLNLLMLIAAHGTQGVTVASASDALWPELDADQAENTLSMTLLRLRRLHAEADLIQRNAGWLHLNPSRVWTDVMALETHLDGLPDVESKEAERTKFVSRLFDLYRGDCLLGVDDDWAHGRAAHYRVRVTVAAQQLLQLSMQAHDFAAAEHTMTRAFERGLDATRLLKSVHPGERATPAWIQLQQHAELLVSG
jgi:DNA-binding SARP family transcriptional activator